MEKRHDKLDILSEMQSYDATKALAKVNLKISKISSGHRVFRIQKIAATLLIPVLLASVSYIFYLRNRVHQTEIVWQTVETMPGQKSMVELPDGTDVWLNSDTKLTYPSVFNRKCREVKLSGEAFFDVTKMEDCPLRVHIGDIDIMVLGTRFNVTNYESDGFSEVFLESGRVDLHSSNGAHKDPLVSMKPGQKAHYLKNDKILSLKSVQSDQYTAWTRGKLIFRDDAMTDVVHKLNRWYNTEIVITDSTISQYSYTATFQHESLEQVLELLKISAPIDYKIIKREKDENNIFSKIRVELY